jgi:hypothetical protein
MKKTMAIVLLGFSLSTYAQVWKTLPQGVRIFGYRNVSTSKITSNFDKFGSESLLSSEFTIDAATLDKLPAFNGTLAQTLPENVYNDLLVGEYKVDAAAQFNVHGFGFGYGITDRIMFYAEIAYYNARVEANIKRTKGNTYEQAAEQLELNNSGFMNATLAANLRGMIDAREEILQSVVTNELKYKPVGDWQGSGYGDMETGFMTRVIDEGTWGLLIYPGVVLPTGRQDDPDIIQDVAFGDGQYDIFTEMATGYVFNDHVSFGTSLRYTYQAPTTKTLRAIPHPDAPMSADKESFQVKYGDRFNLMVNSTFTMNDWLSFTPLLRYMRQQSSLYSSSNENADYALGYNTDKWEHQVQFTTTVSSIQPFLKKQFALPAQINMNLVQTVAGKNVPKVGRFEMEFRMLF